MAKQVKKASGSKGQSASSAMDDNHPLSKLFYDSLKDIYWAEKNSAKALPRLMKAATNEELRTALKEHTEMTKEQTQQLERVFELLGKRAQGKKCEAMEGLIKEAESIVEETEEGTPTRDVGIIMAAQKVEHYEIASYGSLAQLAKTMGLEEVKDILGEILDQEKESDQLLTEIAENSINMEAEEEEA